MKKELQLQNFAGPLDLLLQLIESQELDITTVALADVAEQFLGYLDEIEERSPEELADFLVVATKLLLLKSQALLPYLHHDEEEDPGELAAQLKMYKRYVDAMTGIEQMLSAGRFLFSRKPFVAPKEVKFMPPKDASSEMLHEFFVEVLSDLEPIVKIPKSALARVVTLREKFTQIRGLLSRKAKVAFRELLSGDASGNGTGPADRGDVVVTFLALLELVKKQEISVEQKNAESDIIVTSLS